ncbi:MAG TPA: glycosyltransferase, partial [Candidatus Cybelea sp.]|nr:glycosyltransferase [Candidatus Cybelea sp.]
DRSHPTHVLGFVNNMNELMAVSDLLITKPGGLTTSEALATGKPLFILNPIPGQEAANSDFLLERGAAAKVNRVDDLPFRLGQLLGSKKLTQMADAAKALGRPAAAADICRAVTERLAARRGDQ